LVAREKGGEGEIEIKKAGYGRIKDWTDAVSFT
jgi:hypothetical protein